MIDLQKMSEEHAKLFPKADLKGQVFKLLEECGEFVQATTVEQKEKELADCLIVCAGMMRFSTSKAITYADNVYKIIEKSNLDVNDIEEKVRAKWEINLHRKWKYENGSYHHIGIDGNE